MEFINRTSFAAALYRTQLERPDAREDDDSPRDELLHNALILCCRYPLTEDSRLGRPDDIAQRRTPEPDGPDDPAYGVLLEPGNFPRAGTDVIVIGDAVAPRGATRTSVRLRVGPYDERLDIIGDRVWTRRFGALVPSAPEPFERMPLTWARSFGGAAEGPYGPIPFSANPLGQGYYLSKEESEDKPLPNIEDPGAPVISWSDHPAPVGCGPYPPNWWLRLAPFIAIDREANKVSFRLERGLFDLAHPRLSGKRIQGGQVLLEGVSETGRISFPIPTCPAVADIVIGARRGTREFILDELLIDLRRRFIDLTWRKGFKYPFIPHQTRRTTVRMRTGA